MKTAQTNSQKMMRADLDIENDQIQMLKTPTPSVNWTRIRFPLEPLKSLVSDQSALTKWINGTVLLILNEVF